MGKIFSARWGFRFALVTMLGMVLIAVLLLIWRGWTKSDISMITPTRSYAGQAGDKIILNIAAALRTPPALNRWRITGRLDSSLIFPRAALFWFSFSSIENSFIFHPPDSSMAVMPEPAGWQERLKPVLIPLLKEKKAGGFLQRINEESSDYYIEGRIFADEPRVMAMVTDLRAFRDSVIPAILERARSDFPMLEGFTQPAWGPPQTSWLFVLIRDDRDSIICKLGEPGTYLSDGKAKPYGFKKSYPTTHLGFTMDVILMTSLEAKLQAMMFRLICILTVLWALTMILWAWAEVRLAKAERE